MWLFHVIETNYPCTYICIYTYIVCLILTVALNYLETKKYISDKRNDFERDILL